MIAILVARTKIRINPVVLVVPRMVDVVGRTLVSMMILAVVKGNAMIVIVRITCVMTTISVAVPLSMALVVKRAGS